jgi:hypothetical protein
MGAQQTYPIDVILVDQPPRNAPLPIHTRTSQRSSSVLWCIERDCISMQETTSQGARDQHTLSRSDRASQPASSTSHRATSRWPQPHASRSAVEPPCSHATHSSTLHSITTATTTMPMPTASEVNLAPLRSNIAAGFSDKPSHRVNVAVGARYQKGCQTVLLAHTTHLSAIRTAAATTTTARVSDGRWCALAHRCQLQPRATAQHRRGHCHTPPEGLSNHPVHATFQFDNRSSSGHTDTTTTRRLHEAATNIGPLRSSIAAGFSYEPPHRIDVTPGA